MIMMMMTIMTMMMMMTTAATAMMMILVPDFKDLISFWLSKYGNYFKVVTDAI